MNLPRGSDVSCAAMPVITTEGSEKQDKYVRENIRDLQRTSHGEELVQCGDDDSVEKTQGPHAEGADGHGGVVNARD